MAEHVQMASTATPVVVFRDTEVSTAAPVSDTVFYQGLKLALENEKWPGFTNFVVWKPSKDYECEGSISSTLTRVSLVLSTEIYPG